MIRIYCTYFSFLFLISSCSMFSNEKTIEINSAIKSCIHDYSKYSLKNLSNEVDRVYIHSTGDYSDLLFVRGEMGTFGKRSVDYKSFFSCGVFHEKNMITQVVFIQDERFNVLYSREGFNESKLDINDSTIEYIFLKGKDSFYFTAEQKILSERLNN